jgi:glycosyltransferase involved in cell wall biosynthesis
VHSVAPTISESSLRHTVTDTQSIPPQGASESHAASKNYNDIYINGRFLTQPPGGVQRFARQIVKAIDTELADGAGPLAKRNWTLLVPSADVSGLELRRIKLRVAAGGSSHLWDQIVLPWAARRGILVNLANSAPLFHPRSLVVIHDAAVFRTPQNFSNVYGLLHRTLSRALSHVASICTVSEFSRRELAHVLGIDEIEIAVVPNSGEHMVGIVADDSVLERLDLRPDSYFLFVGSPSPNKNLDLAVKAFTRLPEITRKFVIVGATRSAVFREGLGSVESGVVAAGRLSDAEVKALYRHATALVFPSLYEGFGVPPLEAMANDCPVIAARIPSVIEVCGDGALYFDPTDADSIATSMKEIANSPATRATLIARGRERAKIYSWRNSAHLLSRVVGQIE